VKIGTYYAFWLNNVPSPTEPVWIELELALAIHDRQLAEHGGPIGVSDMSALDSALARPRNQWAYGETDRCALAAAYAYGLTRNHPFTDGNKRTAWVLARFFLALNNVTFTFKAEDAVNVVLELATGNVEESALANWFKDRLA